VTEWNDAVKSRLMAYCRIDVLEDLDEVLLKDSYYSAVSYMEEAGIWEPPAGTARRAKYDLCINALVLDEYDRRDVTITGAIVADNPSFRRKFNQLKNTSFRVSESDT
jgi:hypothetical protein